jgi:hypothetical protein
MGKKRNAYLLLVVKPERPAWKLRCKWKDNIKMDLTDVWDGTG